jgi:hypothetical protein
VVAAAISSLKVEDCSSSALVALPPLLLHR